MMYNFVMIVGKVSPQEVPGDAKYLVQSVDKKLINRRDVRR